MSRRFPEGERYGHHSALRKTEIWYLDAQDAKQRLVVEGEGEGYELADGLVRVTRGDRITILPVARLLLIEEQSD